VTPATMEKPTVPDPPSDLQDGQRLWSSMWQRAAYKNRPMSHDERHAILHDALLAFDRGNGPGLNQAERAEQLAGYFEGLRKLGLLEIVDRLGD
jgi:hypothetical protein